jgi:hypothetical protein
MKFRMKHKWIVCSAALAFAASPMVLPSIADAHSGSGAHGGSGHAGAHFAGGQRGGRGYAYGRGGGNYGGDYCGPIQIAAGLCGPY